MDRTFLKSFFLLLAVILAGCGPQPVDDVPVLCDGKATVAEVLAELDEQRANAVSIRSKGKCKVQWTDEDSKVQSEDLVIELRFSPPDRLFLDGRVLNQEVMRLGSNPEQFWVRMKPKEISVYQWGLWRDADNCDSHQLINPRNVLEALGMVSVDDSYVLLHDGYHDILTLTDEAGRIVKRVYVSCVDYRVARIEYYNGGMISVVVELSDHVAVENSAVASRISITNFGSNNMRADIDLKGVRLFEDPKPKLFIKPSEKGFRDVYKLNENCEFVKQD